MGGEGAKALAAGVAASSSLAELSLVGCGIGDEGAKAFAEAIGASGSLTELLLGSNEIVDEGAKGRRSRPAWLSAAPWLLST